MDINSILISENDNVITSLRDIKKGEIISAIGLKENLAAEETISKGYKAAIKSIKKDSYIFKYGQNIGQALEDIDVGKLVHIHNIKSNRGKELLGGKNHEDL